MKKTASYRLTRQCPALRVDGALVAKGRVARLLNSLVGYACSHKQAAPEFPRGGMHSFAA